MDEPCLFCRIASGEAPSARVFEDETTFGFLDHRPLFHGHCLLIPRSHHETMLDLPQRLLESYFTSVQLVSRAVMEAMEADGLFIAINNKISQSVPHLHTHIVPRREGDGLKGFFWPRRSYAHKDEMNRVREAIAKAVSRIG